MLKFIGVGDLFNKDLGNTSAYIKQNDTVLFLDCGTLTFQRILELDILEDSDDVDTDQPDVGSIGYDDEEQNDQ